MKIGVFVSRQWRDPFVHLRELGVDKVGLLRFGAALAAVPGLAHVQFQRVISVRIDPARPAVAVMAQGGHASVPLIAETDAAALAGTTRALISEPLAWLYGWRQGEVHELVIGGVPRRLFVAGTWRDYARQWGAIVVPLEDYRCFTGDATATEAAFDLNPGADARAVQDSARLTAAAADPATPRALALAYPTDVEVVARAQVAAALADAAMPT